MAAEAGGRALRRPGSGHHFDAVETRLVEAACPDWRGGRDFGSENGGGAPFMAAGRSSGLRLGHGHPPGSEQDLNMMTLTFVQMISAFSFRLSTRTHERFLSIWTFSNML